MKKSKVISTIAISMFAFTMINCSAKHESSKLFRDQANGDKVSKLSADCKINTNNPVGEFYQQVENLKELEKSTMGSKVDKHVVVEVNKLMVGDEAKIIADTEYNKINFNTDRAQAQFVKNFLPNGLVKVYELNDTIPGLPENNCVGRSIYQGDMLTVNNQNYRVSEANPDVIIAEGAKVIETSLSVKDSSATAVTNVAETTINISTEKYNVLGNSTVKNFDTRNNILKVREGSLIRTKDSRANVEVTKHYLLVPQKDLENIMLTLSSQEASLLNKLLLSVYEKQQEQIQLNQKDKSLDEKTWNEIKSQPIKFLKDIGSVITGDVYDSTKSEITLINFKRNLNNKLNSKMSISALVDIDQSIDDLAKVDTKSAEAINFEKKQLETPEADKKSEDTKVETSEESSIEKV